MIKVGINGFGRIGRALFKILHKEYREKIKICIINDIDPDLKNLIYLLKNDSIYGRFESNISVIDDAGFIIDEELVKFSSFKNSSEVDWGNIDILVDATGVKSNLDAAHQLIKEKRLKKVIVTNSPDNVDATIIMGVNHFDYKPQHHHVVSSSICDANAVAHVIKYVNDLWGIKNCFFTTLHPWLSYQNLLDGTVRSISSPGHFWNDYALGRASVDSLIPKKTTAADAVKKVLPELSNVLEAISFRVPTAIVSSSDITITTKRNTTTEEVKKEFKLLAQNSNYLHYNEESLVSIDYKQTHYSAVIDGQWIKVIDDNLIKFVVWYDNEWGYASRVKDVILLLGENL